ncbi:MAG: ABC transporter permease [Qingshengfaniella sp.]
MMLRVAGRIARRELRGGLAGFRVFLLCLLLGVAAIAAVGTVRVAIEAGLRDQGAVMLGGDGEAEFDFRRATAEERAWLGSIAERTSEVVDFRSLAVVGDARGLTQVKGVDGAYPLTGAVVLDPPMPLALALAPEGGLPGGVMQRILADRLGLDIGGTFRLGVQEFRLSAYLETEPDASSAGFGLGPRTIVDSNALAGAGLLAPGTIYDTKIRLDLPEGADLAALEAEAEARFGEAGMDWRDSRNGAPGVARFVDRIGAFLVLVGLAGLAVGGVGISASVRAYLAGKTATIATLKTLGADNATILASYLIQIGVMTLTGVAAGLVLGAVLPQLAAPLIVARLPVPVDFVFAAGPLLEAALYGILTAAVFTLWPLARAEKVRAATLFRDGAQGGDAWPRPVFLVVTVGLAAALVGLAVALSADRWLALWAAAGVAGALVALSLAARGIRALTRRLARQGIARGRPALRLALAAIGGPGEQTGSVMLSIGLGLAVLAAVGQIDSNLRRAIATDLPDVAPAFFFVDIQPGQIEDYRTRLSGIPGVTRVDTAPMLRGVVSEINGRPAREVAGNHWVVRGDRGLTYAAQPRPGTVVTEGQWWPEGYDGPAQISFAAAEAAELGLRLGDEITVNVLGREITATITSFREVDFSSAGIGFVLTMNPAALAGAPHTWISTVYAGAAAEGAVLREIGDAYPNVTAIPVREAIDNVARVLTGLAAALSWGAGVTLVTGFVVLVGAAAAGEGARVYEAAILKTLGATRWRILSSLALRSCLLGLSAGLVALAAGALAGWAVITLVMEAEYSLALGNAAVIILGGVLATLLAGIGFAWRPLSARPARVLRGRD